MKSDKDKKNIIHIDHIHGFVEFQNLYNKDRPDETDSLHAHLLSAQDLMHSTTHRCT